MEIGMEVLVAVITAIIGSIGALLKTFKFVREGELGAKLRFGKFVKVVKPGFVILIPFVEELTKMHVRLSTNSLPPQVVTLKDKLSFRVSAVVLYRVTDIYKALFNIDDLRSTAIDNAGLKVLREVLAKLSYDEASNFEKVGEQLLSELREVTKEWGIIVESFSIVDFEPTAETSEVLTHLAKVEQQIKGNKLLVDSLGEAAAELDKIGPARSALAAALILRGGGAIASVGAASGVVARTNSASGAKGEATTDPAG